MKKPKTGGDKFVAERKKIADDLRKLYGNSLTGKEVLAYIGMSYNAGKHFLSSIDSFTLTDGGHRRYLAIDVAAAIDKRQERKSP